MTQILIIDYTKCHGCRVCETACSMISNMSIGTSKSRITAVIWELEGLGMPIICQQCQDAPCMLICPKHAIYRDKELNRVMVDYDRCIGCRVCVSVCPFGAMDFDGQTSRVIKCDLCGGDPLCAKLCSYGVLQYVDVNEQTIPKKVEVAEKLNQILLRRKAGIEAGFGDEYSEFR